MAEEHGYQETYRLCANNCGFFGSPATQNLCSKCYRDFRLKEENATSAKIAVEKSLNKCPSSSSSSVDQAVPSTDVGAPSALPSAVPEEAMSTVRRCLVCRKKLGLAGFKCKCGDTFCGTHRYPEKHTCGYDFKKAGREEIARANPVVKADKVERM